MLVRASPAQCAACTRSSSTLRLSGLLITLSLSHTHAHTYTHTHTHTLSLSLSDAAPKNYDERFQFRAPAAGAGTITFRALLKQGDTQGGAFFWPNSGANPSAGVAGGDLSLTEGSAVATHETSWFTATNSGQSCDDVCVAESKVCDVAALNAIDGVSEASLEANAATLDAKFASARPMVSSCSAANPSITNTDERWLFFHRRSASDNTCAANEIVAPSCAAVPPNDGFALRRVCPCKSARRRLRAAVEPAAPDAPCPHALHDGREETASGGCPHYTPQRRLSDQRKTQADIIPLSLSNAATESKPSPTLSVLMVAAAAYYRWTSVDVGAPIAVLFTAAYLLPSVSAHNWIWNPSSRSSQASTIKPCRAKKGTTPSIHVNPGQEFSIEWSSGHGPYGPHYFTLVKAEDATFMNLISSESVSAYLDSSPTSSRWSGAAWEKKHLSWESSQGGSPSGGADESEHIAEGKTKISAAGEPTEYITRPLNFCCNGPGKHKDSPDGGQGACYCVDGGLSQWRYAAPDTSTDLRAHYTDTAYPWIVQAHRFSQVYHYANQADTARFVIPEGTPPGEYILHWFWRGYTDCQDIALMPNAADVTAGRSTGTATTVASTGDAMYGYLSESYGWSRIDHAQFGGGAMSSLEFKDAGYDKNALASGVCFTTDFTHVDYQKGRTCFVIPPDEAASVPAPAPVGSSLCSASGMTADPAWGDKIIQCASTATECEGNFMKRSANSFPSPQLTHLLPRSALAIHAFLSSASL